eukprot:4849653-Prymnesium_polylepis.2
MGMLHARPVLSLSCAARHGWLVRQQLRSSAQLPTCAHRLFWCNLRAAVPTSGCASLDDEGAPPPPPPPLVAPRPRKRRSRSKTRALSLARSSYTTSSLGTSAGAEYASAEPYS